MRILLTLILLSATTSLWAQNKRQPTKNTFLNTQWYLGFFAGGNLSKANPTNSFTGYAPLNYDAASINKTYEGFVTPRAQAGLVFMFYTKGFTAALKPGINSYAIEHSTSAEWVDSNDANNALEINYRHETVFNYLEFPLSLQYDLMKGQIRPYLGFGGYYGLLLNANRDIERSGSDSASGSSGSFTNQSKSIGVTDLFITSNLGINAFVGVSYDPGNIRITMDVGYKMGLNNITSTDNRYLNNELSAIGEATDDLQLQQLYLNFGFVFPLKFIGKNFNAIN
jgi:hypothetical protein